MQGWRGDSSKGTSTEKPRTSLSITSARVNRTKTFPGVIRAAYARLFTYSSSIGWNFRKKVGASASFAVPTMPNNSRRLIKDSHFAWQTILAKDTNPAPFFPLLLLPRVTSCFRFRGRRIARKKRREIY